MKPTIPEGWQLVPIEPTAEMMQEGYVRVASGAGMRDVYDGLLAVSPTYSEPAKIPPEGELFDGSFGPRTDSAWVTDLQTGETWKPLPAKATTERMTVAEMQSLLLAHGYQYGFDAADNALVGYEIAKKGFKAPTEQDDRAAFEAAYTAHEREEEIGYDSARWGWQAALRYARGSE